MWPGDYVLAPEKQGVRWLGKDYDVVRMDEMMWGSPVP